MKPALKQALADCLARLEAGAGIEECLRGHDALAAELRPLLEAAQALRARDVADYRPDAFQRGRARMHAARMSVTERSGRSAWAGLWRPLALTGVAAAVAVLAALGLTTGVLRFGADTTSAQVNGVVSRVDTDVIILITADGRVSIRIGEKTIVLDANGNAINGGEIAPGRSARIEAEEENGEYSAQRIEVEDEDGEGHGAEVEFKGVVKTVSGNAVTVKTSFGTPTVVIGPKTKVEGALKPGVTVEVHAVIQDDGSYLGTEIHAKGEKTGEDDGGDGGGSGSSGSGGSSSPEPEASPEPEPEPEESPSPSPEPDGGGN
jgi:hypothetical protein